MTRNKEKPCPTMHKHGRNQFFTCVNQSQQFLNLNTPEYMRTFHETKQMDAYVNF